MTAHSSQASAPAGLLPALPLKAFVANGTTAILDAEGNEVVGWMGFDNSDRSREQHEALARHIVHCVNAHDKLVAALKRAEKYLASRLTGTRGEGETVVLPLVRAAIAKATASTTRSPT